LRLVAAPDKIVEQRPAVCAHCQAALPQDTSVVAQERRQVGDLPPVRLQRTVYRALHVRCPVCQRVTVGVFPAEAPSRAQCGPRLRAVYLVEQQLVPFVPNARTRHLLADLFGAHVSLGTLVRWVGQAAETLEPMEGQITAALHRALVLHSDETGVRCSGSLVWAHVASTSQLTQYAIHPKRGREATAASGILPFFAGVSVQDGWAPYWTHRQCRHALCNIHHLRELTFLEEQYQQTWANGLKALLLKMKVATEQARSQGVTHLPLPLR
jgi:transposase